MKSLHLIMSLPARSDFLTALVHSSAPSLHKLLSCGSARPPRDSLSGALCQAFNIDKQMDWPLAPFCAQADGLFNSDSHADHWLRLDPVHFEISMGGLMLHPPAALDLSWAAAQTFINAINLHWQNGDPHTEGWQIVATAPTRWYLRLPAKTKAAFELHTTPLDQMQAEYVTPHLPQGGSARSMLKQINEAQMLLHAHPLNQQRENEGRITVNGLWLWGGGTMPTTPLLPTQQPDQVAGNLFELHALAQQRDCPLLHPASALADFSTQGHALAVLTPDSSDLVAHLKQLEQNWFKPLLRKLFWGKIKHVQLDWIGHHSVSLTPKQARLGLVRIDQYPAQILTIWQSIWQSARFQRQRDKEL